MAALDLLGRRWALRVLWELRAGPLTFRAAQAAAAVAPSVLNTRLAELRAAGLVEHGDAGYALSATGAGLLVALGPLWRWAEAWAGGALASPAGSPPPAAPAAPAPPSDRAGAAAAATSPRRATRRASSRPPGRRRPG